MHLKQVIMEFIFDRITVDDEICNGQPTIRGMRITVSTVLEFLINGSSAEEILTQYPLLEPDDLEACKQFALALISKNFRIRGSAA
jgi:uncharacterized protein (DUF433 family)